MSQINYISFYLNLKEKNINFIKCYEERRNNRIYKITEASLSYYPICCPICGCVFNKEQTYEKNGFKTSYILLLDISNFPSILRLHKQRYKCHSCNKKFFARTNIVDDGCFISNQVKYAIALDGNKAKVNGKDYDFSVKEGIEAKGTSSGEGTPVKAALPGNVLKVLVSEGDTIEEGDVIAVIEAMKMETEIKSPASGTIQSVEIEVGNKVQTGQVLVTIG